MFRYLKDHFSHSLSLTHIQLVVPPLTSVITLTSQPILLLAREEECCYENYIAYWPANKEIGLRVISMLAELAKEDMDKHIALMDRLVKIANRKNDEKRISKLLTALFDVAKVEELGHFMVLEEDGIELEEEIDKACIVKETSLSPHLYRLTCYVFQ